MRRHVATLVAVIALSMCGATAVAVALSASSSRAACGPTAARTLAETRSARIYVAHHVVYGCAQGIGRVYRLGLAEDQFCGRGCAAPVALAGRFAAYGLETTGTDFGSAWVAVRDLTDGKLRLSPWAPVGTVPGSGLYSGVTWVVVARDGAVAWVAGGDRWIVGRDGLTHWRQIFGVYRSDRRGPARLDLGSRVAPWSLRLHDATITWMDTGTTRSATLD